MISEVVKCVETSVLSIVLFFKLLGTLNSLERNSMEDFQTLVKKQKTVDSTNRKENKPVSKKGASLIYYMSALGTYPSSHPSSFLALGCCVLLALSAHWNFGLLNQSEAPFCLNCGIWMN